MSDPKHSDSAVKTAKPRRLFRVLFGLSLAMNLLVVGAFVGLAVKGPPSHKGAPGLREVSIPYVGAFKHGAKRDMRRDMRDRLPDRSEALALNKADYAAFLEIARAPEFDAERASQIMKDQLSRAESLLKVGRDLAIERIAKMSLEERNAYADRLEGWLEHKKGRRSKKEQR